MSVWFYVALAFLIINIVFIVLFFFAKAKLYVQIDNGKFTYQAKLCGLKTDISFKSIKHKHGEKGKLISTFKARDDLTDLGNLLLEIFEIRNALQATSSKFLRKVKFDINKLNIVVSGKNATQTALLYSEIYQGVSYILKHLDNTSNVNITKNATFSITADYICSNSSVDADFVIQIGFFRYIFWRYILLDLSYNKE